MKTQVNGIVSNGIREAYMSERINSSGMTKAQVAECAGIPPSTLNAMLKRGIAGSALDTVARVCDILDIDLDSFVRGKIPASADLYSQRANMSNRLYQTRVKLRYRLVAVADYLNVPESVYREMEGGLWLISDAHVKQLAALFKVPSEYLYCRTDSASDLDSKLLEPCFDAEHELYNYGLAIRELREGLHISRSDFAAQLKIDTELLSDWENGIRVPWNHELVKISDLFSIPLKTLCPSANKTIYTKQQETLIEKYEAASERDQQLVRMILGIGDTP